MLHLQVSARIASGVEFVLHGVAGGVEFVLQQRLSFAAWPAGCLGGGCQVVVVVRKETPWVSPWWWRTGG
uniref:Uncharacterized protein n=1 Tax=Fagus sylvatica TaxID=28930 RepID=A0A2N9ICD7_FAGSY